MGSARGIGWPVLAAAVLLAGCAPHAAHGGGGIVSTNPCADAILVELLPPDRIAAISHYSAEPDQSSIGVDVAARYRTTSGSAEEVIALHPDLVVANSFTPPATRAAYARAGLKVLYLDYATSVDQGLAQVRELAAAVDARAGGEAMVARIESAVRHAAPPPGPRVPALLWLGGNLASGEGTLLDDMLTRAGFANQAAHYGLRHTGYLSVEQVVADPPRVMLAPDAPGRDSAARAAQLRKRALAHMGARVTQAAFPRALTYCGGPVIVRAMARLAQIRGAVRS